MDLTRDIWTRLNTRNNVLIILLLGVLSNVVKSSNLNTENTLSSHKIDHHLHHQQKQQQQQLHQFILNRQLELIAKNLTNAKLPLASRIASLPGDNELSSLMRPARPIIVKDNNNQQQIQYLRPLSTQSVLARSPQATNTIATSREVTHAKQRSNDNVIGYLYRGARDSVGSMARMVSSFPLGTIVTTTALAGLFMAPLVVPDLKRSLAGVGNIEERFAIQGRLESFVSWIERSVEDLPAFPRLHPQECIKRAVCEVNHDRKKYGLPGLILQVMFPPQMENDKYSRVINKYKMAASYGKYNTSNEPDACQLRYEECVVNLLDVVQNLMGLFLN